MHVSSFTANQFYATNQPTDWAESINKGDIGYLQPTSKSYGPGYNNRVELGSSPNSQYQQPFVPIKPMYGASA
jgi:hypothetical protein